MAKLEEITEKLLKAHEKELAERKKQQKEDKKAKKKERAARRDDLKKGAAGAANSVEQGKETNELLRGINEDTAERITPDADDATGAAGTEEKREKARADQDRNSYLKQIAGAVGGGSGKFKESGDTETKKKKGLFGGIASAMAGLGRVGGRGIGGFMKGIGSLGAGGVGFVKAMTLLATGIAAFAVIIGGATWIVSKMMPSIAEGLREFDGIDGKNLVQVGLGITALGAGFAAMGIGAAVQGIGNLIGGIADGIGSLFGIESGKQRLIDDLIAFGKVKLNHINIKNNSEAMAAYGIAMTAGAAGSALGAIAGLVDGVFGGIGRLFGAVPVLDKLKAFGEISVNKKNVINNAEAMEHYMLAMVRGLGAQTAETLGAVLNFIGTAVDGLTKLIGGQGFLDSLLGGMKKMSEASGSINKDNIANVAGAMASYAEAMTLGAIATGGRAVAGIFNFIGTIADGLTRLIGGENVLDTQLDALKKMSEAANGIDAENVSIVAGAMGSYAKAMAAGSVGEGGKAIGSIFNFVGTAVDGISAFIFGGKKKTTMDKMIEGLKKLSDVRGIDAANVENNATAMASYAKAMALGAGAEGASALGDIAGFVGGVVSSISSFFGIEDKDPITELKKFAAIIITAEEVAQVKINSDAMESYAGAMFEMSKVEGISALGEFGKLFGGLINNLSGWLGVKEEPGPLEKLQAFAAVKITAAEVAQIESNASALESYSKAMVSMEKVEDGAWDALGGLFTGIIGSIGGWLGIKKEDPSPLAKLKEFAAIEVTAAEVTRIQLNASALEEYSKAMIAMDAVEDDVWDALGDLFKGVIGNIGGWLGVKEEPGPLTKLKEFAAIEVTAAEVAQIQSNASALEVYGEAMKMAKAAAPPEDLWESLGELITGVVGNISSWLGVKEEPGPLTKLKEFAATKVTAEELAQVNINANALSVYTKAMRGAAEAGPSKSVWDSIGGLVSGIIDSIGSLFGSEDTPMEKLKEFASKGLTDAELDQISRNSEAFKIYSQAMSVIGEAGEAFEGSDVPNLTGFAEELKSSFTPLNSAMQQFGDKSLFDKYEQSGKNLKAVFGAFKDIKGLGSDEFMGSADIETFAQDLSKALPYLEIAIEGKDKKKGLADPTIRWKEASENISLLLNSIGGVRTLGDQIQAKQLNAAVQSQADAAALAVVNAPTVVSVDSSTNRREVYARAALVNTDNAGQLSSIFAN